MNNLINILKNENFIIATFFINIFLILLTIILVIMTIKSKREYIRFMKKIGNGNNIHEMLKNYITDVNQIKKENEEIKKYCLKLENNVSNCIQKIGIVRYNAFNDVGGDLSFALALLDKNNNGIVLNGIYGSESSNIYSKPIKNGKSTYQLSDEEKYSIELAMQNKNIN